jgi:hypothetical protein
MYKATRLLIDARLKCSKNNLEHVSVASFPIGKANKCHHNTFEFQMSDVLGTGCARTVPVSGWLVGTYNKAKDETEIIQHWWNLDTVSRQHFDTTPLNEGTLHSDYEYVTDFELALWGNEHFDAIDSNVCNSLCLRHGKWFLVNEDKDGKLIYKQTDSLKVENLFLELDD